MTANMEANKTFVPVEADTIRHMEYWRQQSLVQIASLNEAIIALKGKCLGLIREWETTAAYRLEHAHDRDHGGCASAAHAEAEAASLAACIKGLRIAINAETNDRQEGLSP